MKKILNLVLVAHLFNIGISAQFWKKDFSSRDIVINKEDTTIYFSVLVHKTRNPLKDDRMYYWYMNGELGNNVGDFAGYLLHGNVKIFVNNSFMIEKGNYQSGLKHGKWTKWYQNGKISEIYHFSEGLKDGWFIKYNENGQVTDSVFYKEGIIGDPKNFKIKLLVFEKKQKKEAKKTEAILEKKDEGVVNEEENMEHNPWSVESETGN